ncbi:hypothetical protein [Alteromonas sp. MmMcT2-5]|jgi:hypothetical protein|uniref:hypothetical protein n=1 Tax=Alteromonas sp. MmMcT2-5 TaxID=2917733 RepID=UPI001EF3B44B|nr:hypothetical protein [Alteromonas sp. MmMcT2-5]MCG7649981.1 hypothetical protein [Alteromonas sp. MmMcT2-5]
MEKLRVTAFKGSSESFCEALDEAQLKHSKVFHLSESVMASGLTIEIILHGGFGALAVACLAWVRYKKNRRINIRTKEGTSVWLEGYSAEDATKILEQAESIAVIETGPNESSKELEEK